jgi:hypothetical protein
MQDTKILDKSMGSRHRAALGITEETDAVVVVVSEERGSIAFCFNGNIVSNLDGASLRQALLGLFGQRSRKRAKTPLKRVGSSFPAGMGSFRAASPSGLAVQAPQEVQGSDPPPSAEPGPRDKETSKQIVTRPMATATRIETPKPVQPPEPPSGPREE